jgi:hypothetical protein
VSQFAPTFRLEKKLAVLATVLLSVLGSDSCESLTDCASGLIGGENAFAFGADGAGILD